MQARDNTLTPVTIRMLMDASYAAGAKSGANYQGVQLAQVSQRPAASSLTAPQLFTNSVSASLFLTLIPSLLLCCYVCFPAL